MIQSYVIRRPGLHDLQMYDTIVDGKQVYVAVLDGFIQDFERGLITTTQTGNETRLALIAYADEAAKADGFRPFSAHYVDIPTAAAAKVWINKALAAANSKDVVIFACRGEDAVDAATIHLNCSHAAVGNH